MTDENPPQHGHPCRVVELNEAVADAQSGYGHSSDQIHTWMKSWGTENELPAPEPDITPSNQ